MAIAPPSDIVLEVARAADPERAAAVARRLGALAADAPDASMSTVTNMGPANRASAATSGGAPDMRARIGSASDAGATRASKAEMQFESVLMNSFVNEMLPKDAPDAFGQGLAGEMWRSLLAEKISNQIARSGALGLGERLFATHPLSASARLTRATRALHAGAADAAQMSANALSVASGADVRDGAVLFADAERA